MKKILKFTLLLIFPFNILFAAPTSNNKGNETWEIQLKFLPKNLVKGYFFYNYFFGFKTFSIFCFNSSFEIAPFI